MLVILAVLVPLLILVICIAIWKLRRYVSHIRSIQAWPSNTLIVKQSTKKVQSADSTETIFDRKKPTENAPKRNWAQ